MNEPARLLAGHPARSRNGHAPVERDRDLVRDERPPERDERPPLLDLLAAAESDLTVGDLDGDTGLAQPTETSSVLRVWVVLSHDHLRDTRFQECIGTRWRRPVMSTGLQGDVGSRTPRALARGLERDDLGVWAALSLVPTFADHVAAPDDHGTDDRVGMRGAATILGQLDALARGSARPSTVILGSSRPYAPHMRIPPALAAVWRHEPEWLDSLPAQVARVRGTVGSRARGACRHPPLARRPGGRRGAEAERAVA